MGEDVVELDDSKEAFMEIQSFIYVSLYQSTLPSRYSLIDRQSDNLLFDIIIITIAVTFSYTKVKYRRKKNAKVRLNTMWKYQSINQLSAHAIGNIKSNDRFKIFEHDEPN